MGSGEDVALQRSNRHRGCRHTQLQRINFVFSVLVIVARGSPQSRQTDREHRRKRQALATSQLPFTSIQKKLTGSISTVKRTAFGSFTAASHARR